MGERCRGGLRAVGGAPDGTPRTRFAGPPGFRTRTDAGLSRPSGTRGGAADQTRTPSDTRSPSSCLRPGSGAGPAPGVSRGGEAAKRDRREAPPRGSSGRPPAPRAAHRQASGVRSAPGDGCGGHAPRACRRTGARRRGPRAAPGAGLATWRLRRRRAELAEFSERPRVHAPGRPPGLGVVAPRAGGVERTVLDAARPSEAAGVVTGASGCGRTALLWNSRSLNTGPRCTACSGLPEEQVQALALLLVEGLRVGAGQVQDRSGTRSSVPRPGPAGARTPLGPCRPGPGRRCRHRARSRRRPRARATERRCG